MHTYVNVEEVNEQDPNDIAYFYSGYAPLSVRLVQCVLQKQYLFSIIKASNPVNTSAAHGWQGYDDALKSVRGETFNRVQKGEEHVVKARHMLSGAGGGENSGGDVFGRDKFHGDCSVEVRCEERGAEEEIIDLYDRCAFW